MAAVFPEDAQPQQGQKLFVTPFALLKEDVSVDDATLELATLLETIPASYQDAVKPYRPVLISFPMSLIGDEAKGLMTLVFIGVLIMLILTCANITTVLFARSDARAKEIALRIALGASERRIALLLIWESGIISLCAGVLGLLIAQAGLDVTSDIIERSAADLPAFFWSLNIDNYVFLSTLVMVFVITLISGTLPAWRFFSSNVNTLLKQGASDNRPKEQATLAKPVMLLSVALSCCLFSSAVALFAQGRIAQQADYGVIPSHFTTLRVGVIESQFDQRKTSDFFASLMKNLSEEQDIHTIFGANPLPGQPALYRKIDIEPTPPATNPQHIFANSAELTPGTMQTLGVELLAGRHFDHRDSFDSLAVAIVTRSFVQLAGENMTEIIGKRVRFASGSATRDAPWLTIVGVSEHIIYGKPYGFRANFPTVFTPASQNPWRFMSLGFDRVENTEQLIDTVERHIEQLGSNAVVIDAMPYDKLLQQNTLMLRFVSILYLVFALLAVALSTGSFYGIVFEQAQSRGFELGVRQAIGATENQLIALVMKEICLIIGMGCLVGGVISYFVIEHLYQQLQIVSPVNTLYVYLCPLFLFSIVSLITYFAVKPVVSNEPAEALRYE